MRRPPEGHNRKMGWESLGRHVRENPDVTLEERAKVFGESRPLICYALQRMGVTVKKKPEIRGKGLCGADQFFEGSSGVHQEKQARSDGLH